MGIEEVEILWRGGKHRHNPSSKRGQSKLFLSLLIPVGMNEEISFVCSLQSELRLCWVSLFLYVLVSYFIRLSLERLRLPLLLPCVFTFVPFSTSPLSLSLSLSEAN